jgi:isopentenyl-diphosphate delta-isomerase
MYTIVNEQDEVIGYKSLEDISPTDIYRVSALWITNNKGEILLAQRALSKKNDPGKWGPAVAGTVEEGETYDSNIAKEAFEELGLRDIEPVVGPKVRMSGAHQYWLQWYSLVVDKPIEYFKPEPKEVMAIRWVAPADLKKDFEKDATLFLKGAPRWIELFCK